MSLSFILFILLAATCEYVFISILVLTFFSFNSHTAHSTHAAL